MNRRAVLRGLLAAAAMTTGLARARLDLVEDKAIYLTVKTFGDTWIEATMDQFENWNVPGGFIVVESCGAVYEIGRTV